MTLVTNTVQREDGMRNARKPQIQVLTESDMGGSRIKLKNSLPLYCWGIAPPLRSSEENLLSGQAVGEGGDDLPGEEVEGEPEEDGEG